MPADSTQGHAANHQCEGLRPAMPPCPATTGRKMASAATLAIVDSKKLITNAARNAVPRLMNSQGSRLRTEPARGPMKRSPVMPAMRYMSSVASSVTTSTTSSQLDNADEPLLVIQHRNA